jgi:dolichol-phosphate mannosyltransferase
MNEKKPVDVSIIVPVYNNEDSLVALTVKIQQTLRSYDENLTYEFIFVDDGSRDRSFETLMELQKRSKNIRIVKFTRNFGQVSAIYAGYEYSSGACQVNISADLQDPPELIAEMLEMFRKKSYDIVICSREGRDENLFRILSSKFFYFVIKKLSFRNMPKGGFDYCLISAKVKEHLLRSKEINPFWQGQILWPGYTMYRIPYTRQKREHGKSQWDFSKKIKYLIDGVLAYSYFPLRLMSAIGIITFLLGILYAIVIVIRYFTGNYPFQGWAPIMILLLVLSGIQMLMIGISGEYLWRILDQVRNRPKYEIDRIIDG